MRQTFASLISMGQYCSTSLWRNSSKRSVIKILDRPALEKMSCECYQTLLDQSAVIS